MSDPKPVLKDDTLYFTDNGAIYHGKCCGMSARYTGRDISGQAVMAITAAVREQCLAEGLEPKCERCR